MKKIFSFLLMALFALTSSAQSTQRFMRVTKLDGTTTRIVVSEIDTIDFVTETYDTHEYVDLGLPSGTLWATCNVGATNPEDYGDYFAWGETTPKTNYSWQNYKYCNGSAQSLTKYCTDSSYGTIDKKTTLDAEDDAATVNWGGNWRMPTKTEQEELCTECTWTWTTLNNVKGYRVTGKNGNSIFLPAAGQCEDTSFSGKGEAGLYWSSSLYSAYFSSHLAKIIQFNYRSYKIYEDLRNYGLSVRPVCSPQ